MGLLKGLSLGIDQKTNKLLIKKNKLFATGVSVSKEKQFIDFN